MTLLSIRRYPVKSCGGEALDAVELESRGLVGDRMWAVVDPAGKLGSGKDSRRFRRLDRIFEIEARSRAGVPEVRWPGRGWQPVDAPGGEAALSAHVGAPVVFGREGATPHHDDGPVSLIGTASLRALAELAGDPTPVDPRHFRVSLVVETDEPWVEQSWCGAEVRIGAAALRATKPIVRCRMVDIEQDGVPQRGHLLTTIGRERAACFGIYLDVVTPGTIRTGDPVVLH